jgi:hypothetical protein
LEIVGETNPKEFRGFVLEEKQARVTDSTDVRKTVIDKLKQCLIKRFDTEQSNLLKATKIADFTQWPVTNDGILILLK